jgi:hypothetical protein
MPELKLIQFNFKTLTVEPSTVLSVFVEKGELKIVFRKENFQEHVEKLVSGEKKSWNESDLLPFINFIFVPLTDPCILHYRLEEL